VIIAVASLLPNLAPSLAAAQVPLVDTMALRSHTYFLADDLLEGRGTGRRGADVAALYLAAALERLGLTAPNGSFYQDVPLIEADVDTALTRLTLVTRDSSGEHRAVYPSPAVFIPNAGTAATLVPFEGPMVWVGSSAMVLSQASRLPDLAGRVALMDGVFGSNAAAADTLKARGIRGVIHLVGDPRGYDLYARSRGGSRMYPADPAVTSSFVPGVPAIIAHPALARLLLGGVTEEDLAGFFDVPDRHVQVTIAVRPRPVAARNVAAIVPGSDPARRDEYVVYTAHYDHLGFSTPDEHGDSLYNGFSDNAAGSAMLLSIAAAMMARPPQRSVMFLWLTGEERGLLGSDYYVAHPLVPLDRVTGVINLDAGAPPAPSVTWRVAGGTRSELGAMAQLVARRNGWRAQLSPPSPNSDYFPFLRVGVPAVFLVPGPDAFEGLTVEQSQGLRQRWDRYHQAGDHWAADFPFAGVRRYAEFALLLGLELARSSRPGILP
jgi:hypothetical protein